MFKKIVLPFLALAVIASATPAFSQSRFMNEARDHAQRRAENKAVREAEHPEAAQTAAEAATPATPAAEAQAAPAPATTASNPTPAPAQ